MVEVFLDDLNPEAASVTVYRLPFSHRAEMFDVDCNSLGFTKGA